MKPGHRYREFVGGFAPTTPRLPLMHVTYGRNFVSILDNGRIEPGARDAILNKKLSFHFYGQPSYRPKPRHVFGRSIGSALFCLVLDFNALPSPSSVLPFDSGGYGATMQEFCDGIELPEFLLPAVHDSPARIVSALFGNNAGYFKMRVRKDVQAEVQRFDLHSQGLIRLLSSDGPVPYDQRAGSIEVHYAAPLELNRANLLAIIAPDEVHDDPELVAFAAAHDAERVPYPFDHEDASVRQRQIRDAAQKWLTDNGYMDSVP